jgi:serine/threonine protein kinase
MKQLPQIPGYKIIKKIGHGGMADVYLGVQEKLARQVAIKVLDPLLLRDDQFAKRFIKEAQTAAQLDHHNIITIHDVGVVRDSGQSYYYIVMEYLAESLNGRLKERGPLPPVEALEIVKNIAAALDYAHKRGFIHRDIKPDNIMFRFDGSVVLGDFGIARAMDSTTQLTRTGMSIGTPHYMSPEQCKGEKIDGRSDIYSLGVQLYEMLIGEVPYKAENTAGIIIKHLQDPIPRLPKGLSLYQSLIDNMMAKERNDRIKSGAELIYYIDALLTARDYSPTIPLPSTETEVEVTRHTPVPTPGPRPTPVVSPPIPPTRPTRATAPHTPIERKKRLLSGIAAALVVILIAVVIVLVTRGPSGSETPTEPAAIQDVGEKGETQQPVVTQEDKEKEKEKEKGKDADIGKEPTEPIKTVTVTEDKTGIKTPEESKSKPPVEKPRSKTISKVAEQKPVIEKIEKKEEVRTVTLLELPRETLLEYNREIERIEIQLPLRKAAFRAHGPMSVTLYVNETGNVSVLSLKENLVVIPEQVRKNVLGVIRMKLNTIKLPAPKDKQGQPVRFQWRLPYKVGKFGNKIILTKK